MADKNEQIFVQLTSEMEQYPLPDHNNSVLSLLLDLQSLINDSQAVIRADIDPILNPDFSVSVCEGSSDEPYTWRGNTASLSLSFYTEAKMRVPIQYYLAHALSMCLLEQRIKEVLDSPLKIYRAEEHGAWNDFVWTAGIPRVASYQVRLLEARSKAEAQFVRALTDIMVTVSPASQKLSAAAQEITDYIARLGDNMQAAVMGNVVTALRYANQKLIKPAQDAILSDDPGAQEILLRLLASSNHRIARTILREVAAAARTRPNVKQQIRSFLDEKSAAPIGPVFRCDLYVNHLEEIAPTVASFINGRSKYLSVAVQDSSNLGLSWSGREPDIDADSISLRPDILKTDSPNTVLITDLYTDIPLTIHGEHNLAVAGNGTREQIDQDKVANYYTYLTVLGILYLQYRRTTEKQPPRKPGPGRYEI
ncbi:MAG: hypothetical protein ACK2T3_13355, partial [Candidatus Promineifilaceae bacterium]